MKGKVENCVRFYREKMNLTQQELAESVKVSRQTIIAIEKNDYTPSVYLALKISDVLGKNVENVFTCRD